PARHGCMDSRCRNEPPPSLLANGALSRRGQVSPGAQFSCGFWACLLGLIRYCFSRAIIHLSAISRLPSASWLLLVRETCRFRRIIEIISQLAYQLSEILLTADVQETKTHSH